LSEINDKLAALALDRQIITYAALAQELRSFYFTNDGHDKRLWTAIGDLTEASEAKHGHLIGVLVVQKKKRGDGLPGPGLFTLAARYGRDVSNPRRFWESERDRVFAYYASR